MDHSEVEQIISLYQKRLDEIIVTRDSYRSPDKKGEEEKYKYLEQVNSESKKQDDSDSLIKPIKLFSLEDGGEDLQMLPHSLDYYKNKTTEISKLVPDQMTVGLLALTDLIEDIYDFNFSKSRENYKNNKISVTVQRLTDKIHKIVKDGKEVLEDKFGAFVIEPFGSSVNGLYMHSKSGKSDLDLSINFYYNPAVSKEEVLQVIIPAVDQVSDQNFKLILESVVPIIKYTDSQTGEE